jgi:hypothetical protein
VSASVKETPVSLACEHGGKERYVGAGELTDTTSAAPVQRRTLTLLFTTQIIGGVGVAIGIAVGALLAADMGGTAISGLGQSALVVGSALLAIPVTALTRRRGRRPGLTMAYLIGALGATIVVVGARLDSVAVLFVGLSLFGGGTAANLQARYAAVDLAEPARRGRQLSIVVWATTIGRGRRAQPRLDRGRGGAPVRRGHILRPVRLQRAGVRPRGGDPLVAAAPRSAAAVPYLANATPVSEGGSPTAAAAPGGLRAAAAEVFASPAARLGIVSVALGHTVMIAVMSMTPVHIGESNHGDVLRIVGIVLSAHIAGMYAFSLITGWLTDKLGRRPVILGGVALLLTACAVAGTAGHDTTRSPSVSPCSGWAGRARWSPARRCSRSRSGWPTGRPCKDCRTS